MVARLSPQNIKPTISHIEKTWNSFTQKYPFEPEFLDVAFANRYDTEQKQGQVFMSFSVLAVLIACLGIFGLGYISLCSKDAEKLGFVKF